MKNGLSPKHYSKMAIQPTEFIFKNDIPFCEGNVIKYVSRWRDKGGVEDLKKAMTYIQYLIDNYERGSTHYEAHGNGLSSFDTVDGIERREKRGVDGSEK
jgi:hypothetical protein